MSGPITAEQTLNPKGNMAATTAMATPVSLPPPCGFLKLVRYKCTLSGCLMYTLHGY